jgi:hypothetical protein
MAVLLPFRAGDNVHQLRNLAPLVHLVSGRDGVLDAMSNAVHESAFGLLFGPVPELVPGILADDARKV